MTISTVTSEALQLKLRQLLPSQQGFGGDLSASDTIIPIIDLTAAAEGSDVGENLQTALAFGSQTAFVANNSTVVIANSPGFYRIFAGMTAQATGNCILSMTDGVSTKVIYQMGYPTGGGTGNIHQDIDITVFLGVGESISAQATTGSDAILGSSRQIADTNGVLIQPSGFNPQ
jgi:hypothetical protein